MDVAVTIPADLSHTGKSRKKVCAIDACIAQIVVALEAAGVLMRGSCCGHGVAMGEILLDDGRTILVLPSRRDLSHSLVAWPVCGTQSAEARP